MVDDCPMTEDCPGFDRDRRACLLRAEDCEFAPARDDSEARVESPEAPTSEAPLEAWPR